jgi:hypothetical protein
MAKKQKTNVQFIKSVMEMGSPMNQVFVVNAVLENAKRVLVQYSKEEAEEDDKVSRSMVSTTLWRDTAVSILEEYKKEYGIDMFPEIEEERARIAEESK